MCNLDISFLIGMFNGALALIIVILMCISRSVSPFSRFRSNRNALANHVKGGISREQRQG